MGGFFFEMDTRDVRILWWTTILDVWGIKWKPHQKDCLRGVQLEIGEREF